MQKDPVIARFIGGMGRLRRKINTIYLFGSRARSQARPDSDYDLFLIVSQDFSLSDKSKLYDQVMDILLETGRLVSLKIFKVSEFDRLRRLETPFIQNVLREGIKVG